MRPDILTIPVEVRASEDGPMLRGVILTEGRAASGGRAELFAPGSVVWPSDGIGILTEHRATGEIRVEARATDAIRRAVDVAGRRYMSVEFHAQEERTTAGGVREVLRAMVDAAALVCSPEYDVTSAEIRRSRGPRLWWL